MLKRRKKIIKSRGEHTISRKDIDPDALKVLYRLNRYGHTAYLVGGCVRDILLEREPKDFDIGTSAHPNEIKKLFRNCFLVGRRFRLAHIRFGTKIIETSTFRRMPESAPDASDPAADLFHKHDNTFGTPEEDAIRRDFTINGLFYDIETFALIDYVGGLKDLRRKTIRCIGDPDIRFREDPVRMLRAVRFSGRLGFRLDGRTYRGILKHHAEITKAPPSRLMDETQRLFGFQRSEPTFRLLAKTRLMQDLLPDLAAYLDRQDREGRAVFWRCLKALDAGSPILPSPTPALQMAALHLPLFLEQLGGPIATSDPASFGPVARRTLDELTSVYHLPRRTYYTMIHMFEQLRRFLPDARRVSRTRFMRHPVFAESLALFEILVRVTGHWQGDLAIWQQHWHAFDHAHQTRPQQAQTPAPRRRRRRRPRRTQQAPSDNPPGATT